MTVWRPMHKVLKFWWHRKQDLCIYTCHGENFYPPMVLSHSWQVQAASSHCVQSAAWVLSHTSHHDPVGCPHCSHGDMNLGQDCSLTHIWIMNANLSTGSSRLPSGVERCRRANGLIAICLMQCICAIMLLWTLSLLTCPHLLASCTMTIVICAASCAKYGSMACFLYSYEVMPLVSMSLNAAINVPGYLRNKRARSHKNRRNKHCVFNVLVCNTDMAEVRFYYNENWSNLGQHCFFNEMRFNFCQIV